MRTTQALTLSISLMAAACGGGAAGPGAASPGAATPSSASGDPSLPKPATKPDSDKVTWKKDASPKSCHTGAKSGDPAANVAGMSDACVDKKMHLVGQTEKGEGSRDKMVKTLPLKAEANKCYRVVGIADATVTDLDIAVMDSAGKSVAEDLGDTNDAAVLEDGVFCFKEADAATINVAVAAGQGKWAVQVWSD